MRLCCSFLKVPKQPCTSGQCQSLNSLEKCSSAVTERPREVLQCMAGHTSPRGRGRHTRTVLFQSKTSHPIQRGIQKKNRTTCGFQRSRSASQTSHRLCASSISARLELCLSTTGAMDAPALVDNGSLPLVAGSLLLVIITLIILYLKPKSNLQPSLKPPKTAASLEVPSTPGKPTVRILYGTQVRQQKTWGQHSSSIPSHCCGIKRFSSFR